MATILAFPVRSPRRGAPSPPATGEGRVVIFPGIRYEALPGGETAGNSLRRMPASASTLSNLKERP